MEVLSRLLKLEEDAENLLGIKISKNTRIVSYLLYADDLMLCCRVNEKNLRAINRCFEKFFSWLGQQVNAEKSRFLS